MGKLKPAPIWVTFANEMKAMFADDPGVRIVSDQGVLNNGVRWS